MIQIGDEIPSFELRTDEGTPLALTDLAGRSIAIFLLGETFSPTSERLLKVIAKNTGQFMSLNFSPVVVSGEPATELGKYRKLNDVPFLLVSDTSSAFHNHLRGDDGDGVAVWLVSDESKVQEAVPNLPPTQLVSVVLARITRLKEEQKKQEE